MALFRSTAAVGCLLFGSLGFVACGGDSGDGDAKTPPVTDESTAGVEGLDDSAVTDDDVGTDQSGSGEVRAPEFVLTGPVEASAGWVLDPANCSSPDESGPPFFDYYVPGEWERRGSGYGGSGGVGGSGDHSYELPERVMVSVRVETDTYAGTDPLGGDGQPWTTWDNDVVHYADGGEQRVRVTYAKLDPIEIDGESFDLYFRDQAQSDVVSASEYKLRIVFADVPTGGAAGNDRRPESATVSVSWDADKGDLPEAMVREMLSTFRLATCAQEGLVEMYETLNRTKF